MLCATNNRNNVVLEIKNQAYSKPRGGDQMSRNKIYAILTFYLRKRRVYIHITRIRKFGGLEVLA